MKLNLDEIIAAASPWDLSLTLGGADYPTRPITIGQLMAIDQAGRGRVSDLAERLRDLFTPARAPDLHALGMDQLMAIVGAVSAYAEDRARKNSPAIAAQTRAAMGLPTRTS